MVEVAEQLHLAQGPETEHGVIKRGDLLDRDLLAGRLVYRRADHTVGSFADDILDVILLAHVEGDLAGRRRVVGRLGGSGHDGRRLVGCASLQYCSRSVGRIDAKTS